MAGCPKCKELVTDFPIRSRSDLRQAVAIVQAEIESGVLSEIQLEDSEKESWRTSFQQLLSGPPDDLVLCYFGCRVCGQRFQLSCETYHGAGGGWRALAGA